MSRAKLWRLMTDREKPDPKTQQMAWGKVNEFRAVAELEAYTGLLFDRTGDHQKKYRHKWLTAVPDGSCWVEDAFMGVEVKCPEKPAEEVRPHYMAQVQGECYVCDFDAVYFAAWTQSGLRVWLVTRSEEYISEMLLLLSGFKAYLDTDDEPPRLRKRPEMPEVPVERLV